MIKRKNSALYMRLETELLRTINQEAKSMNLNKTSYVENILKNRKKLFS